MYIWSRIKHFFARITPHNLVEFWLILRMPKKAASFLDSRFDKLAPKEVRRASGDYGQKKWDFMGAAKFFLNDCKPSSTVAILNEWFKAGMPHAIKPNVIINMMLTVPHMAFGMTEEEKKAKVGKIITLITVTNKPLLKNFFLEKGTAPALLAIMQIDGRDHPEFTPAFVPFLVFDLPELKVAVLFVLLAKKANNPEQAEFLRLKLPSKLAGEIKGLMDKAEIGLYETEAKKKELKKKIDGDPEEKKRKVKGEETLTELMQSISNFIDQFVDSPKELPEGEGEKKA